MDAATKKLFALLTDMEKKLSRLDDLEARLNALDTNGRLDAVKKEMEGIKEQMNVVATNSRLVVNQVEVHGGIIERVGKTLARLDVRCPLMKPGTDEFPKVPEVSERKELKDE